MLNEKNVIGVDWGPSKVTCEPMHGVPVEFRDFKDVFELTFPVMDPRAHNVWGCFTPILFFMKHTGRLCDAKQCNLTL